MTVALLSILSAMLQEPTAEIYGLRLCEITGLKSGTIYPALARLEQAGWLASRWEDASPSDQGRPRRRFYRLTGPGEPAARKAIDEHLEQLGPASNPSVRTRVGIQAT